MCWLGTRLGLQGKNIARRPVLYEYAQQHGSSSRGRHGSAAMNQAATRGRSTSPATLQQRGRCPFLPLLTRPNSSPPASSASTRTSPIWIGFDGVFTPPRAAGALFFASSPPASSASRRTAPIWSSSTASPTPPSPTTSSRQTRTRFGLGRNRDEEGQSKNSSSESERI